MAHDGDEIFFYLRRTAEESECLSTSLYMQARLDSKTGNLKAAIAHGEESIRLWKELGYPGQMVSTAHLLSEVYEEAHSFEPALKNYKLCIEMRDSVNNLKTQPQPFNSRLNLNMKSRKRSMIWKTRSGLSWSVRKKERQRLILFAAGVGLLLITGFLIFVFNRLRIPATQDGSLKF